MDIEDAILVGIIQGLLEWFPVSSSGQTLLFIVRILGIDIETAYSMSLFIHLGTLLSAIVFYKREVFGVIKSMLSLSLNPVLKLWLYTTPISLIIGYPIYLIYRGLVIGISFDIVSIGIGVSLIVIGIVLKSSQEAYLRKSLEYMGIKDYIILGIVQGASVLPGVSRSGITIATLILLGFGAKQAVYISFLASIPVLLAASVYTGIFEQSSIVFPWGFYSVGTAFLSGFVGIWLMVKLSKKLPLYIFALVAGSIILAITIPAIVIP